MTPVTFTTVYTEFNQRHRPQQKALCEARKSSWCIVGNLLMWNLSSEAPRCSTTAQSDSDAKRLYRSRGLSYPARSASETPACRNNHEPTELQLYLLRYLIRFVWLSFHFLYFFLESCFSKFPLCFCVMSFVDECRELQGITL